MDKISFTKIENDLQGEYRTKISAAESTEDARKFFGQTALKLLGEVFEGQVPVTFEDIALDGSRDEGFRVAEGLAKNALFSEVWANSDLPHILRRFAEKAGNRLKHLEKNPEKTESKMYHR